MYKVIIIDDNKNDLNMMKNKIINIFNKSVDNVDN